jgi:hypothetical protein
MNINRKLTNHQRLVIATVAASATPQDAFRAVSTGANTRAACDMLMRMGALTLTDSSVELTDVGKQIGKGQGILDDSGTLTDAGQQLVPNSQQLSQDDFPMGGNPASPQPPLPENFTLHRQMRRL